MSRVASGDQPVVSNTNVDQNLDHIQAGGFNGVRETVPQRIRRRPGHRYLGYQMLNFLEVELRQMALGHFRQAVFGGDVEAAGLLTINTPRELQGAVALAAYYLGAPIAAYRSILDSVWSRASAALQNEVNGDLRLLRSLFRAGRFEIPFTGTLQVYRGVVGIDHKTASRGMSWTTSRDVACWFALREAYGSREPLVVAAEVDARDIIYYSNGRSEAEVILRRIPSAVVDPERSSWDDACRRQTDEIRCSETRTLLDLGLKFGCRSQAEYSKLRGAQS